MSIVTRLRRPPAEDKTKDNEVEEPRRKRPVLARVVTGLACVLVLSALIAPNDAGRLTPGAFVRIPLEALLGVALALLLPPKWRRIVAAVAGVVLGLLAILKIADMGFYAVLARPFHPVFDWPSLGSGVEFLETSMGRTGAIATVFAIVIVAIALVVFMALAVVRLARLVAEHRTVAIRAAAPLGVAWVACALLGAQIVHGVPVANVAAGRLGQIPTDLNDRGTFAAQMSADAFHTTPAQNLLTGLRGKDVVLAFVESYGRGALENPQFAPQVGAVLDAGNQRLRAAGYSSRSAFLTSPTAGGGSWLAHSTLLSGLWVNNQKRYQDLVASNRFTLTRAFGKAGWRTVAVMPGTTRAWTEGKFYGYNQIYDRWHLGYRGPRFNWGTPPDQFTLAAFQRFEREKRGNAPVMAEIPLVTSHAPWAPLPRMIGWKDVGDGSAFNGMPAKGDQPDAVWKDAGRVRTAYRDSIEYSLNALISYVETYGDKNLVLIFLGDHQAAPLVVGSGADHDVPITIVARDPAVLNQISKWGWQDGLKPGPKAPVWPMNSFRDRFLTAFGKS